MKIIKLEQIKEALRSIDVTPAIEAGFVAYSKKKAVVPPVGELLFKDPPGDVHIKYGYLVSDDYYVIKIASGFYENPKLNLSSSNGLNLLFSQKTGELLCILLDKGHLTDLRTAMAGAIVAKYLAPQQVHRIGIVGTGIQARLQLRQLLTVINCRDVIVWGRKQENLDRYQAELAPEGFAITTTRDLGDLAATCNLIVTTTPATAPLLTADQIHQGTHITAVGADTPNKQELDAAILEKADLVVADSISQCLERGEIAHVRKGKLMEGQNLVELGRVISGEVSGRTSEDQITVADLTGVAVQDIQISKAVYEFFIS
ncbi:MAG: ornithine cyclodeaminase family protein [bacterium]